MLARIGERLLGLIALILVGYVLGAAGPASARGPGHATRVVNSRFSAPDLAKFGRYYYLYSTGKGFPVRRATSPTGHYRPVTKSGLSMPRTPSWVGRGRDGSSHLWAPYVFSVHRPDRHRLFVMYFVGFKKGWRDNCIGVATSRSPYKGFRATGTTICAVHSHHEAIDPAGYRTASGRRYVVFKTSVGNRRDFQIQRIRMDSTRGTTPIRSTRAVMISSRSHMEAPSVIRHDGKVWLFLSRGSFTNCTYSTDAWSAPRLTGAFHRVRRIMTSASTGLCGPGGATVLSYRGQTWVAFHAWKHHTPASHTRVTWVDRLVWPHHVRRLVPYLY